MSQGLAGEIVPPRSAIYLYHAFLLWISTIIYAIARLGQNSVLSVWNSVHGLFVWLGHHLSPRPSSCLYYPTVTFSYGIKVTWFYTWSRILRRSYVIRHPCRLPELISPHPNVLRTFTPTVNDIDDLYIQLGVHVKPPARLWKSAMWVAHHLIQASYYQVETPPASPAFPHLIPKGIIDLRQYRLEGPRLQQGQGLIGHNGLAIFLIEEYGRWPGRDAVVVGNITVWNSGEMSAAQIPSTFLETPEYEERIVRGVKELHLVFKDLPKVATDLRPGAPNVMVTVSLDLGRDSYLLDADKSV